MNVSAATLDLARHGVQAIHREIGRRSLINFTEYTFKGYKTNWHHRVIANELDMALAGQHDSVIICVPPQNGKSELVSRRFPAYALGKNPNLNIVAASYGATLATEMSRDVQRIMDSDEYAELFPQVRLASSRDSEQRSADAFDVVGYRGKYRSVGVGGGVTGKTAHIGIIDDPIKSREEAESEVYRNKVWKWYRDDFSTRFFGTGIIVILCTRWHQDDLVGRILELSRNDPNARKFRVVSLPAILESEKDRGGSYDKRAIGEALWPDVYPLDELARRRAGNEYGFAALYQQRPIPAGGGLFKRQWFEIVKAIPAGARFVRAWDKAGTEGDGDWTAGVLIAEFAGVYYIVDVVRMQLESSARNRIIKQTAALDVQRINAEWKGVHYRVRLEQEPGSGGKESAEISVRELAGYDVVAKTASGEKYVRALPVASQAEAMNVKLLEGAWNTIYLDEMCVFPFGKHDDQVDPTSAGFNELALGPRPIVVRQAEWG